MTTTIYTPTSDFETAIVRRMIDLYIESHRYAFGEHVGTFGYLGNGRFELINHHDAFEYPDTPAIGLLVEPKSALGTIWVEDEGGSPVVRWEMAQ